MPPRPGSLRSHHSSANRSPKSSFSSELILSFTHSDHDSNVDLREPKARVLPLHYRSIGCFYKTLHPKGLTTIQVQVAMHYSCFGLVWRIPDSNRSPSACKTDALPNELIPQAQQFLTVNVASPSMWTIGESNPALWIAKPSCSPLTPIAHLASCN